MFHVVRNFEFKLVKPLTARFKPLEAGSSTLLWCSSGSAITFEVVHYKSYRMTLKQNPSQFFLTMLFIMLYKVVLEFEPVHEILNFECSNQSYWALFSQVTVCFSAFYGIF